MSSCGSYAHTVNLLTHTCTHTHTCRTAGSENEAVEVSKLYLHRECPGLLVADFVHSLIRVQHGFEVNLNTGTPFDVIEELHIKSH